MSDNNNLLDPTHPKSPFNKFNYDSPYSVLNPLSPHYNPRFWDGLFDGSKASFAAVMLAVFGGPVIVLILGLLFFGVATVLTTPFLFQVCIYGGPFVVGFGLHCLCRAEDRRSGRSDTGWFMGIYWIFVVVGAVLYFWS